MEPERTPQPAELRLGAPDVATPELAAGDTDTAPPDAVAPEPTAVQEPLPFGPDEPIPYRLTARARRFVAPEGLPSLRVVDAARRVTDPTDPTDAAGAAGPRGRRAVPPPPPDEAGPVDLDDPHDTRPSQARALRRAGLSFAQIACELDVDALVAQAWVDDVSPVRSAQRRLRAVRGAPDAGDAAADVERRARFEQRRSAAARDGAARLPEDAGFARGLGLVSGVLTTSEHAALLTTRDEALAAAALRWILDETDIEVTRVRVLLRLAPQVAGDAAAHAWAERLGLPSERVVFTRWRGAPSADAVEATVRFADPDVAGTLAGWRDALLGDVDAPTSVDDAF